MKIGFDAKRAFMNNTGLGNYSRSLIKGLYEYEGDDNRFVLYTPKLRKSKFYQSLRSSGKFTINTPDGFINTNFNSYWRSFALSNDLVKDKIDIYHGLSNELPLNINSHITPCVVSIHDLIFLRFPKLYPFIDKKIYDYKFKKACEKSSKIIAVSNSTKNDIMEFYNIPDDKIEVHYQCCNQLFFESDNEKKIQDVRQNYGLPKQFALYVGTIEERKNLLTVLKALRQVKDLVLVVIGRETNYIKRITEYINQYKLNTRIIFLGNVDNDELKNIYSLASVFIYPSIFEGFGIPVIEALLSKTPVITSNISSLPEAGGENSIQIDPYNADELAFQINRVLSDTELQQTMKIKGYEYAQQFHPKITSNKMINLYQSLL